MTFVVEDEKSVNASGLVEGSKIVLAAKKIVAGDDRSNQQTADANVARATKDDFWAQFYRLLLRHFKKDDADKMLVECQKV
jgi:hypothetical protein